MKFLILASIIALSMIGIVVIQSIDARECLSPCDGYQYIRIKDTNGKSINVANLAQQYTLSWNVNNHLSKFVPCQETIMVNASQFDFSNRTWGTVEKEKCISGNEWVIDESINDHPPSPIVVLLQVTDEKNRVEYLAWIEASVPPNDSKKFEFSWTPNKIGQHTLTVFTWKSLDNPTALLSPSSTAITVGKTAPSAFLENKSNITMGCTIVDGTWLSGHNECESSSITEEFENYCNLYGGTYHSCHSGCRHSPDWPNTICATQCIAVCEFE